MVTISSALPPIAPLATPAVAGINPLLPPTQLAQIGALATTASVTDVSALGTSLAATASALAPLASANVQNNLAGGAAIAGQLQSAAQLLVDTLNSVQADTTDGTLNALGDTGDNALLRAIDRQLADNTGEGAVTSLAGVGIGFDTAPVAGASGQFSLDTAALREAAARAPAATATALAQALQTAAQLAAQVFAPRADSLPANGTNGTNGAFEVPSGAPVTAVQAATQPAAQPTTAAAAAQQTTDVPTTPPAVAADARAAQVDPVAAAAVAAYRLGDLSFAPALRGVAAEAAARDTVAAAARVQSVALDLGAQPGQSPQQTPAAESTRVNAPDQSTDLAAVADRAAAAGHVDIRV